MRERIRANNRSPSKQIDRLHDQIDERVPSDVLVLVIDPV